MKRIRIRILITALHICLLRGPVTAESGMVQWEKHYNGPGNGIDSAYAVAADSAGNVIVAGPSTGAGSEWDYYTAKYSATDGALLWDQRYNGPDNRRDLPTAVLVDGAGDVIVTGGSTALNTLGVGQYDYYTVKYAAADGAILWERRYDGPAASRDIVWAAALDSAGNVIVTGESRGVTGFDYYTAKYAAVNGALLWEQRYDGPAGGGDYAYAVTVDWADNVIVTGWSDDGIYSDYCTVKYAAADGELLWEVRYNGPGESVDSGIAVVADPAGNVFVTGWSTDWSNPSGDSDHYYTAKYAASDGRLIWEKAHNGPITLDVDYAVMAVDERGNLIFSGPSPGDGTARDYYTAKFAAADGALLWEKRYNGPRNGDDIPHSVALDAAGNVIVTGSAAVNDGHDDIYTAVYAAADGALLWERRYDGPNSGDDIGVAVTVDNAGSIIVSGRSTNAGGDYDFYTVKYAPVDLDGDNDGLPDSWEVTHFGSREGQSALDDTDGDGAVELLELAFGTDPRSGNSVPSPAVVVEGGYITTTITKQPRVRYLVETGGTLESDFSAASTTVLTDTSTTLKVRDNVPVGTQSGRFLRVQVTAAQ